MKKKKVNLDMFSTDTILRMFQDRVKFHGGQYLRRYCHRGRTKYWCCENASAFKEAASELGLELSFRSAAFRKGLEVFVEGLTMKGSRQGVHRI